jgi:hypothetical protein
MKLTRRELAAVVSATAMAAPAAAQTGARAAAAVQSAAAQTEPRAANPADDLQAARDRIKATGNLLAQQPVPMATEPAFQFKA